MMHVIDKGDPFAPAQGQEVSRRVDLVIILQTQSFPDSRAKALDGPGEPSQSPLFVPIRTTTVDIDSIRSDHFGQLSLIVQLGKGPLSYYFARRVQQDELVGMESRTQLVLSAKGPATFKGSDYLPTPWQLLDPIAHIRVGVEGKNLAVDAKITDAVFVTVAKCLRQRASVVPAYSSQDGELFLTRQAEQRFGGFSTEFDRLLAKNAAQPQTDHVLLSVSRG
jgi:hypothetical protein